MTNLHVCVGSACHVKGSYNVINTFQQIIEEENLSDKVVVKAIFCLGKCTEGVSVKIDDGEIYAVTGITARKFFKENVLPRLS
ncbi:(2Fe-2S) ferredoxin domain-containing protein [Clostridium sp. DL1XJH146]